MAGISGIDEFREFSDSMREISGQGRSDGVDKARRSALKETAKEFRRILKEQIQAAETAKGGTLYSETSPYTGGENESTKSGMHMQNVSSWEIELAGSEKAKIYPHPEIYERALWLEYGTKDHPPSGENPMYFYSGGVKIVLAEPPEGAFEDVYKLQAATGDEADARFRWGEPTEVSGVEAQNFWRRAVQVMDELDVFKENMADEIDKLFEEEGIVLEGEW